MTAGCFNNTVGNSSQCRISTWQNANELIRCMLCLKKVHTFKLSVTLSNLNRFSNFLHRWESVWNLLQNLYDITHLTLGMLIHYLGKLKIEISCTYSLYSVDMPENANKLHFECTDKYQSPMISHGQSCGMRLVLLTQE